MHGDGTREPTDLTLRAAPAGGAPGPGKPETGTPHPASHPQAPHPPRADRGHWHEAHSGPDTARAARADITARADLDALLRRFYGAAFADPVIGAYFTEIAGTDLDAHLPRITDFWERALLRTADYRGDAFAVHHTLHRAAPLTARHFGRWVQLWRATVDGGFAGPRAERAKAQGERIALAMLRRLSGPDAAAEPGTGGFIPLATLELRRRSA
ncbi:group III truncated hemoglobin [Embleya sp. NBC_00888]|uniref:group III truncated hemoglobin n=1 Tax=Embleya sp. NBC_00888 TaxID=2975960 RepID=UPI0038701D79|nr:group III truncated hemoglobin [Embleya sp. NBC_00888]